MTKLICGSRNMAKAPVLALRGLLLATAFLPAAVLAQSADATDGGDIVVTALKRDTKLQDTPIAITATTGEGLAKAGITDFSQLTRTAPSLTIVDAGAGARRVLIRGIQAAGEPTVGVYYDETPVAGSVSTSNDAAARTPDLRLFDVSQVEVLRGPQGTLFGSGSMGGTLRILYNKPTTKEVQSAIDVQGYSTHGGGPGVDLNGMINLPVTDTLAVRAVGYFTRADGYVDNVRYGRNNVNDTRNYGGRLMARFEPVEGFSIGANFYFQNMKGYNPRWYADLGAYKTDARSESYNTDKLRVYNLTAQYDFGPATVTAVSSYFDRQYTQATDVSENFLGRDTAAGCKTYLTKTRDCTTTELSGYLTDTRALFNSSLYIPQNLTDWTNELRVASNGEGRLQWTAGLFYDRRKTTVISQNRLSDPATGLFYEDPQIKYQRTVGDKLTQKAVFGEASYEALDGLTLTAGARYFKYSKRVSGRYDIPQIHYSTPTAPTQDVFNRSSEDGTILKFNASYKFAPNVMGYVQAGQGFRPGGVNQVISQLPAEFQGFKSDSLWNYEAGLKTQPLRWLTINGAIYQIDWKDIQVTGRYAGQSFSFISNAGAARIRGGELEVTVTPTRVLTLQGSFSYNDAKLTEDQATDFVTGAGKAGNRLAYIPKVTAAAGGEYAFPLSFLDGYSGMIRGDIAYQGSSYSEINGANVYYRKVDDYTVVNMRAGVEWDDDKSGMYVFVNNVFDKVAVNTVLAAASTANRTTVYALPPRTIGLQFRKRF